MTTENFDPQYFAALWGPGFVILILLFFLMRRMIDRGADLLRAHLEGSRDLEERKTLALERQAAAAERGNDLGAILDRLHERLNEIGMTLRVFGRKFNEAMHHD